MHDPPPLTAERHHQESSSCALARRAAKRFFVANLAWQPIDRNAISAPDEIRQKHMSHVKTITRRLWRPKGSPNSPGTFLQGVAFLRTSSRATSEGTPFVSDRVFEGHARSMDRDQRSLFEGCSPDRDGKSEAPASRDAYDEATFGSTVAALRSSLRRCAPSLTPRLRQGAIAPMRSASASQCKSSHERKGERVAAGGSSTARAACANRPVNGPPSSGAASDKWPVFTYVAPDPYIL